MASSRVLILPGLCGSGPTHWQTLWEIEHGYARVHQDDWERPYCAAWIARVQATLAAQSTPAVLVAHSLGAVLVAHLAVRVAQGQIAGALLVAPADVDDPARCPEQTRSFGPLPLQPLGFPATVVASQNDPYIAFERARELASAWGASFVDAGAVGHINAESGLGHWPAGHRLLQDLC